MSLVLTRSSCARLFDFTVKHTLLLKLYHYGKVMVFSQWHLHEILIIEVLHCSHLHRHESYSFCYIVCNYQYMLSDMITSTVAEMCHILQVKVNARHFLYLWEINSLCALMFTSPHASCTVWLNCLFLITIVLLSPIVCFSSLVYTRTNTHILGP